MPAMTSPALMKGVSFPFQLSQIQPPRDPLPYGAIKKAIQSDAGHDEPNKGSS
jgi:hypothetical protein